MSTPDPLLDYPLGERRPELVTTPAGTPLAEVTLDGLRSGRIVARRAARHARRRCCARPPSRARPGRTQLAENLERAAELASLPDDEVLSVYTALRPRRATAAELEVIAQHLADVGAPRCAAFVREAAVVMAERGPAEAGGVSEEPRSERFRVRAQRAAAARDADQARRRRSASWP